MSPFSRRGDPVRQARDAQARQFLTGITGDTWVQAIRNVNAGSASTSLPVRAYDPLVPDPSHFADFMRAQYPEVDGGPGLKYTEDDMRNAFEGGWEAAMLDHDC